MKLLFRRILRTLHSEQYALYDHEQLDEEQLPLSLGKVDLHYASEAIFGTMLLWAPCFAEYSSEELRSFVQEVMDEFSSPMGVPDEFFVETALIGEQDIYVYSNMLGRAEDDEQ